VCVSVGGGVTTISPGGSTTPTSPIGPDVVVGLLGQCTSRQLCRDANSYCFNGTCLCQSSFYHDGFSDQCSAYSLSIITFVHLITSFMIIDISALL